jgi:hypothetical protein
MAISAEYNPSSMSIYIAFPLNKREDLKKLSTILFLFMNIHITYSIVALVLA